MRSDLFIYTTTTRALTTVVRKQVHSQVGWSICGLISLYKRCL